MSEQERKAFEKTYSRVFQDHILDRDINGDYVNVAAQAAWRVYQAARSEAPASGEVEPVEWLGERCIDGGRCHHACDKSGECFRRTCCEPFSDYSGPWKYTHPPAKVPDAIDIKTRIGNWVNAVVSDCRRNNDFLSNEEGRLVREGFEKALSLVQAKVEYFTPSPAKVPEDVVVAARGYLLSDGPYDWSSVDRAHAVKVLANRGLLTTPTPATTPETELPKGWKLVPIEPTESMMRDAADNLCGKFGVEYVRPKEQFARAVYRQLVGLAPTPPQEQ